MIARRTRRGPRRRRARGGALRARRAAPNPRARRGRSARQRESGKKNPAGPYARARRARTPRVRARSRFTHLHEPEEGVDVVLVPGLDGFLDRPRAGSTGGGIGPPPLRDRGRGRVRGLGHRARVVAARGVSRVDACDGCENAREVRKLRGDPYSRGAIARDASSARRGRVPGGNCATRTREIATASHGRCVKRPLSGR